MLVISRTHTMKKKPKLCNTIAFFSFLDSWFFVEITVGKMEQKKNKYISDALIYLWPIVYVLVPRLYKKVTAE